MRDGWRSSERDPVTDALGPSPAVDAVLRTVLAAVQGEEWEEAVRVLEVGLGSEPGDPYLLCWLGLAERELGLEAAATEHFRMVLDTNPQDPVLLATTGNALAATDDPAAGLALRTAALLAPDLAQARWMYGAFLAREGMVSDALKELGAAARLEPDDPVIHLEIGVARALAGEMELAANAFGRAIELDPEDGWPLLLLGLARVELGDLEEALGPLDEGARLRPDDLEAQLLAALALAAAGWEERAMEMLERARVGTEPGDEDLLAEVDERIEDGPEAALACLAESLGPSSFRERLLQRP
jgi:tetratricopeptide (TPR) repeat protein